VGAILTQVFLLGRRWLCHNCTGSGESSIMEREKVMALVRAGLAVLSILTFLYLLTFRLVVRFENLEGVNDTLRLWAPSPTMGNDTGCDFMMNTDMFSVETCGEENAVRICTVSDVRTTCLLFDPRELFVLCKRVRMRTVPVEGTGGRRRKLRRGDTGPPL
jgi:hypothetical protein